MKKASRTAGVRMQDETALRQRKKKRRQSQDMTTAATGEQVSVHGMMVRTCRRAAWSLEEEEEEKEKKGKVKGMRRRKKQAEGKVEVEVEVEQSDMPGGCRVR